MTKTESFDEWVIRVSPEIKECLTIAQSRVSPGDNLYVRKLEELFDISGVALRLLEEATEYHHDKVAEILATYPADGNKKSQLDAAKKTPCAELTILTRMETLVETIKLRTTQAQSITKGYCK